MTLQRFANALRILHAIDYDEVDFISAERQGFGTDPSPWQRFAADPVTFFMRADDATQDKLWAIIEARQPKEK